VIGAEFLEIVGLDLARKVEAVAAGRVSEE
jgi:hypothetical protein